MKIKTLMIVVFILATSSANAQEESIIDSLQLIIKNAKHDTIRILALKNLDDLIYATNPELDLQLNERIDSISSVNLKKKLTEKEKYFFKRAGAFSNNNIGVYYQGMAQYDRAIKAYQKSKEYYIAIKNYDGVARIITNFGNISRFQGNYDKAIEYYNEALKIQEKNEILEGAAYSLNNIGLIYKDLNDYEEALKYFKKSLVKSQKINNPTGIALAYGNIGTTYNHSGKFDKAIEYYEKSMEIKAKTGDRLGYAYSLNNIGLSLMETKSYDSALVKFQESYEILKLIGDLPGISGSLNNMGIIYRLKGDYHKAKLYCEQALKIAQDNNMKLQIRDAAESLWMIYKHERNYLGSLNMYELFIHSRDSIKSEENQKEVIRQEYKNAYEKQAAQDSVKTAQENKVREAQIALQDAEIKTKNNMQYMLFSGLALVIVFAGFMYNRFKITQKQKGIIEEQKHLVEEKHKEITDSINYAERIQRSFLATSELLNKNLKDYFVFFQPKDVVSGDFYWASKLENGNFAYVCADSTGHGVPGAIMSILNISSLELSVKEKLNNPSDILNFSRSEIINRLKKDGSVEGGKDGMDASLIILNTEKTKLFYSAANNPIWIIRNKELIELNPDKMPVGKHDRDQIAFSQHEFDLQKGDLIYSLTDGMPDQFGGPKGKKYKYKQLKEFLIVNADFSMEDQYLKLKSEFGNWKGDMEQVDDVTIIGVRI